MALQFTHNDSDKDLTINNAYAKIDAFSGNKDIVRFSVQVFTGQSARENNKQPVGFFDFELPYTDGMSIASLYTYLKTLPEFAGALDV